MPNLNRLVLVVKSWCLVLVLLAPGKLMVDPIHR
jgi:hypothetical protein